MKLIYFALIFSFALSVPPLPSTAQAAALSTSAQPTVILHVEGVRNTTGVVRFAIFATDAGWPDDKSKAIKFGSLPANGNAVTFSIPNVPAGKYAVSVFHDENENHKVDRDLFGRPKEGIGFANNPKIGFTAPSWNASSINVAGPSVETTIHLRYP